MGIQPHLVSLFKTSYVMDTDTLLDYKKRLLFVCLGNICRSPAAEGVMKHIVEKAGLGSEYYIDSAGIGAWHTGQLPDSRMRRCGASRGYDFSSRARQITQADFSRFDLILVMDDENLKAVSRMARNNSERAKVRKLIDFARQHKEADSIPDPYYGGQADFDYALDLIEDSCQGLFEELQSKEQY